MVPNLLEGFGDWLKTINIKPSQGADHHIVMANVTLEPEDGSPPVQYPRLSYFRVLKYDPQARWARIQDASKPDPQNPQLSDFPHAVGPSKNFGHIYLVRGAEFDKFIQPQMPQTPPGGL